MVWRCTGHRIFYGHQDWLTNLDLSFLVIRAKKEIWYVKFEISISEFTFSWKNAYHLTNFSCLSGLNKNSGMHLLPPQILVLGHKRQSYLIVTTTTGFLPWVEQCQHATERYLCTQATAGLAKGISSSNSLLYRVSTLCAGSSEAFTFSCVAEDIPCFLASFMG